MTCIPFTGDVEHSGEEEEGSGVLDEDEEEGVYLEEVFVLFSDFRLGLHVLLGDVDV